MNFDTVISFLGKKYMYILDFYLFALLCVRNLYFTVSWNYKAFCAHSVGIYGAFLVLNNLVEIKYQRSGKYVHILLSLSAFS